MVWHTHMLNPRSYLEDAMLAGLRHFWVTGLPWNLVNKAIDNNTFAYNVSDTAKARWVAQTGMNWDNTACPSSMKIPCPRCSTSIRIPWTTCGLPENDGQNGPLDLTGNGYGDSNLQHPCPTCRIVICKELLSVAKFVDDTKTLIGPWNVPMPGTLLDLKSGMPSLLLDRTFPNHLLKSGCNSIRSRITELITSNSIPNPTMDDVRRELDTVLQNKSYVREISGVRGMLPAESRIAVRKMMSRYWENASLFALDLRGAVMRQGIFVEKMCQLDWLHSPSARDTMSRLLKKYGRFFEMMKANPNQVAVPTLDIDLAWHTHQLSPGRYYAYSYHMTGRFTNHDDKIDENKLSAQFAWTSKEYQDRYGEVYSECTCWYCEGISPPPFHALSISTDIPSHPLLPHQHRRQSPRHLQARKGSVPDIPPPPSPSQSTNPLPVAETFHTSGAARFCPPSNSARTSPPPTKPNSTPN
jgi:hypothetical protein